MSDEQSTALTTRTSGALVRYDYGDNEGAGFQNTDQSDFAIPFLAILQSNSPQIDNEAQRIDGAVPGMLYNTVTGEVSSGKEGIVVVPCLTEHVYTEWVPRNQGGGFRGRHDVSSAIVQEAVGSERRSEKGNKPLTKDGNELVETFYIYALVLDEVGAVDYDQMVIIAFTSTKIKKYKKAMTTLRTDKAMANAPLFAHQLRLRTVQETNSEGTFYNFDIAPALPGSDEESAVVASAIPPVAEIEEEEVPHPILVAGDKFMERIGKGEARADYESLEKSEASDKAVF